MKHALPVLALLALPAVADTVTVTYVFGADGCYRVVTQNGGAAGGQHLGPADTVPGEGPALNGPANRPMPDGVSRPGPSKAPAVCGEGTHTATRSNPASTLASMQSTLGPESWWTWWELNKLDYLRPNLVRNWVRTVTGWSSGDGFPGRELEFVREQLMPVIERRLSDPDAGVRAAAVLAMGRIGGEAAVEPLLAALDDSHLIVRERALLALGATGSNRAALELLHIAEHGARRGAEERVAPEARALALMGLGVGRRNGFRPEVDVAVSLLTQVEDDDADVQMALAAYRTLTPNSALEAWSLQRASDGDAATGVRCRALEALRFGDGDEALAGLLAELGGRKLELRRSAALGLGELDHPRALPSLLAAIQKEKEPLTRAFLLLSIGRQGGDEARVFLADYLENGPRSLRSWAALGMGILARHSDDDRARLLLQERFAFERNEDARGAWYLAMGIGDCQGARALLERDLTEASTPAGRAAAAFGLAMLGGDAARSALRAQLEREPSPGARTIIAQSIGYLGDERDAEVLLTTLDQNRQPDLTRHLTLALGLHGTRTALEGLVDLAAADRADAPTRAASLEAVQLLVGRGPNLTFGELLRQTNFAVFPSVVERHLDLPL